MANTKALALAVLGRALHDFAEGDHDAADFFLDFSRRRTLLFWCACAGVDGLRLARRLAVLEKPNLRVMLTEHLPHRGSPQGVRQRSQRLGVFGAPTQAPTPSADARMIHAAGGGGAVK